MEASRRSLRRGDGGDARVRLDLDRYHGLAAMMSNPDRRAVAEDSLYSIWSRDPGGVLWPELAARYRPQFRDFPRLQAIFEHPAFPDSATALGAYLREWRRSGPRPDGSGYRRAQAARAELTPFEDAWFALRLARFERLYGRADEAARLALEALPAARRLGGWRLELEAWLQAALALQSIGHLADAQHAAAMAEELARGVSRQTGNVHLALDARFQSADVLAARREVEAALGLYASCADEASSAGLLTFAGFILNRAGIFTAGVGRYEEGLAFYRQALLAALADRDSLNATRHLANIGQRHRMLGDLDSCRFYLEEAERWIRAYPDPTNLERFPLIQAEYYAQVGNFAVVDSLHAVAATLTPRFSPIAQRAELHLQLIRQGMERGRPAQVYRSLALLDSLRDRLQVSFADRNEIFDLDLASAEFLGRQGQFARAAGALDRADSALSRRPDAARQWELFGARGHLARRRNDPAAAESAYRASLTVSDDRGGEDRLAQSRLWLAALHLDQGRLEAARTVLSSGSRAMFDARVRTRLSAMLLGAIAESRSGRFAVAIRELDWARERFRSVSPPDLLARLDLETGRALAGLGRRDEARRAYARVKERLAGERRLFASDDGVFLDSDLRRELAEAVLGLAIVGPGESLRGRDAETALRDVEAVLPAWHRAADGAARRLAEPQILYFVGIDASYRWTLGGGLVALQRLPGEAALVAAMAPVLADLREPTRRPVVAEIAALTAALGGPVPGWASGGTLTVVPDGPLLSVPWPALASRGAAGRSWIDQGPIVLAGATFARDPAAARTPPDRMRLLALGVDASPRARASGLAPLRHAEREARDISARWPAGRASLRIGEAASRRAITAGDLSKYDVIHISSHALVYQGLADQATLLLAGADDAPLTAAEIRQLELRAELVFLSSCEAAEGVRRGVGPAHAGLARSFLDAGARNVIASGVRVDDEAGRQLAVKFYGHWLDGATVGDALRMAQLDMRDCEARWAHPYYWAFYQVIRE